MKFLNRIDRTNKVFAHGGDLGDTLAGCPAIALKGGGDLVLWPRRVREPWHEAKVERVRSFLELQPYIHKLSFEPRARGISLDGWRRRRPREAPGERLNITDWHTRTAGLPDWPREKPWFVVDQPNPVAKVVINRTPRYHGVGFPWRDVVAQYGRQTVFVGLQQEWEEFVRQHGAIAYYPTTGSLLELARVVAGAEQVVCNQSSTCWLAFGLGKPVWLEEWSADANCYWDRDNCQYGPHRVGRNSKRVAVVLAWDDHFNAVADVAVPNRQAYCQRHGYEFVPVRWTGPRAAQWAKIDAALSALDRFDVVFVLDADAVITDINKPLTDLIGTEDLVTGSDRNGLNDGALIVRSTPWAKSFLRRVWDAGDYYGAYPNPDQSALAHLLACEPQNRWRVLPQRALNSYQCAEYGVADSGQWHKGDFVLHTPGLPIERRVELLRGVAC